MARGWAGVHSLPRLVALDDFSGDLTARTVPQYALKTSPLPALTSLRNESTHVHLLPPLNVTLLTLPITGKSIEIEVAFVGTSYEEQWDGRVEVLAGSTEKTVVGIRSGTMMADTDLEDTVNPPHRTLETSILKCRQLCEHDIGCASWTSLNDQQCEMHRTAHALHKFKTENASCYGRYRRNATSGYAQHTLGDNITAFAQLYMLRNQSSLPFDKYGLHSYAHSLRLRPGERVLTLRVFADVSIVEAFAQGGRSAVTGRVYPTRPDSVSVRVTSQGLRILSVDAWRINTAFDSPPPSPPRSAETDWRNVTTGNRIWPLQASSPVTYQDQPQISILKDGSWFVVWTHGVGKNEGARNIILSMKSFDKGKSWISPPVNVEPFALNAASSASWANPLVVGDKLYVFYTFNCWNTGRGGNPGVTTNITRNGAGRDANLQGCWYWKVSTDGGRSFAASTRHNYTSTVAAGMRFELDRTNPYQTHSCRAGEACPQGLIEGWSTGKPLLATNGDIYMQMTKIGGAGLRVNQGIFLRSRNLRPGTQPADVPRFDVLPRKGGVGLRAICADDGPLSDYFQEGNIVEIDAARGRFYAIGRSNCGWITAFGTTTHGDSWSVPGYALYDTTATVSPNIKSHGLKQPCGPLCPRRIELSTVIGTRYLLLFYNNGFPRTSDSKSREVYWISAGRPSQDGATVFWSQPEVAFYEYDQSAGDPSAHAYKSVDYPDFIFQDGEVYVAATNKDTIATHHIPRHFWQLLLKQNEVARVIRDSSLLLEFNSSSPHSSSRQFPAPDWGMIAGPAANASFTIEVMVGAAFSPAILPPASWRLLDTDRAPFNTVAAASCINNLTLLQCGASCRDNVDCRYFWFYADGRCCPKISYDLKRGWLHFKKHGGWYELSRPLLQLPLLDCRDVHGKGVALFAPRANASANAGEPLVLLDDGTTQQRASGDATSWASRSNNTVAVVVDGAARLISFVTNGVLADGGLERAQGWARVRQQLSSLTSAASCVVAEDVICVRLFSRALMTTELVSNWRAAQVAG
eukprot:COSAG01_NODE_182_length_22838_cov_34.788733_7_plen_1032_part_00